MLIDAKKIWISGGYGLHNNFETSLKYIRQYGAEKNIAPIITETILSEIFITLASEEDKYIFEGFKCPCGCGIDKSGTALIHEIISRLDTKAQEVETRIAQEQTNNLNEMIKAHMTKIDADYLEANPVVLSSWSQRNLPTFRKILRLK